MTLKSYDGLTRRQCLAGLATITLLAPGWIADAAAHTPYQQWQVYRKRHLIIGTSREEQDTYALGKQVAKALALLVPESNAKVARARTVARLASLIRTDQLKLVLVSATTATELYRGVGRFEHQGNIPLRVLAKFDTYLLLSRVDFPKHHAWTVARAMLDAPSHFPGMAIPAPGTIIPPPHAGVLAAVRGQPQPPAPVTSPEVPPSPIPHAH